MKGYTKGTLIPFSYISEIKIFLEYLDIILFFFSVREMEYHIRNFPQKNEHYEKEYEKKKKKRSNKLLGKEKKKREREGVVWEEWHLEESFKL